MEAARISSFSGDVTLSVWINFESEKNVAHVSCVLSMCQRLC